MSERNGTAQPEEEQVHNNSCQYSPIPEGAVQREWSGARFFSGVSSIRIGGNGYKLEHRVFCDHQKNFCAEQVMKYWHRLPSLWGSASSGRHQDMALDTLI